MASPSGMRPGSPSSALSSATEARILLVEDEAAIRDLVARTLRVSGFVVQTAATYTAAVSVLEEFRPELAILDVMLPDGSGLDLCQALRSYDDEISVVFLTARDSVPDRLNGFALGGDDYVTKPFSIAELVARVNAVLRRSGSRQAGDALVIGDLIMRDDAHEVTRGERALNLSPTEYRLLRYLLVNQRRVMSKEQILGHVWQYDFGGDATVVEKFVSQLRRKVDAEGEPLIHTVRGFGYVIRSDG